MRGILGMLSMRGNEGNAGDEGISRNVLGCRVPGYAGNACLSENARNARKKRLWGIY